MWCLMSVNVEIKDNLRSEIFSKDVKFRYFLILILNVNSEKKGWILNPENKDRLFHANLKFTDL